MCWCLKSYKEEGGYSGNEADGDGGDCSGLVIWLRRVLKKVTEEVLVRSYGRRGERVVIVLVMMVVNGQ